MAVLLFGLKPALRDRLPKFTQYYLWLVVIAAFLLPVSKIILLPGTNPNASLPVMPNNVVNQYVVMTAEISPFDWVASETGNKDDYHYKQDIKRPLNMISVFTTLFMYIYPFGVLVVLFYSVISFSVYIRLHRLRNCPASTEEKILFESLCVRRRIPLLYRNPLAATPMLIGVFNPAIILPDREYTEAQLRAVLLHELTHLKRKDIIIRWLTVLACAVHWFNPTVWFVRHEIDRACELSCDEAVISGLDREGKQNYGDTLIYLASETKLPKSVVSTTMCEEKKALKERLGAIMKSRGRTRTAVVVSMALIIAAIGAVSVLGAGSGKTLNNQTMAVAGTMTTDNQANNGTVSMESTAKPEIIEMPTPSVTKNINTPDVNFNGILPSADDGQESWQLNPEEVALRYAVQTLGFQGTATLPGIAEKEYARVVFTKQDGAQINFDLYQPVIKGKGGIWSIDGWYDENNAHYQIRDLTSLPPLFYNDDNVPQNVRDIVRNAVVKEWTEAFGAHYQVLGFEANQVEYIESNNEAFVSDNNEPYIEGDHEAYLFFTLTIITKNFYKDPDTVDYIIEAKKKSLAGYQLLYKDYNMPRSGSANIKATLLFTA
ncbi:MAG: M56 family metallopeptidase, partial [Treponema sp.]|nr:M56 family metallopeptidase [Treponema sp.]